MSYEYLNVDSPNKEQFFKHIHNDYEILYFKCGDADYIIGTTLYHLKKNDLLIIKPAEYHQLKVISPAHYERHVINFNDKLIPKEILSNFNRLQPIYSIASNSTIDKIFDDFVVLVNSNKNKENIVTQISYALRYIIVSLYNTPSTTKHAFVTTNNELAEILSFIDKNPDKNLNSQILSNMFFVSPSWITHTFKKTLGISLKQYINIKKILYAQQLISKGTKPTKVAELCSFDNYSTFYRLYKKYTNTIPQIDKKNHNQN